MSNNDFGVFCGNGLNEGNYSFEFLGYKGQCTPNGFQYTYDINSASNQTAPSFQPSSNFQPPQQASNAIGCPSGCHFCVFKDPADPCRREYCCTDEFKSSNSSALHQAAPTYQPAQSFQLPQSFQPPQSFQSPQSFQPHQQPERAPCPIGCHLCFVKSPDDPCPLKRCCTDEFKSSNSSALYQAAPTYQPAPSYQQAPSVQPAQKKYPCAPRLGGGPTQGQPCPDGCYLCAKKDPEDPCPIDMCCSLPI